MFLSTYVHYHFLVCNSVYCHDHPGVYVFRTALLYEVDKDEHLGKRNVMGEGAVTTQLEETLQQCILCIYYWNAVFNIPVPVAAKSNLGPTHIPTPAPPISISLSSDSLTLSVYVKHNGLPMIYFYDTRALSNKVALLPYMHVHCSMCIHIVHFLTHLGEACRIFL